MRGAILLLFPHVFMCLVKHRNNFTFTFTNRISVLTCALLFMVTWGWVPFVDLNGIRPSTVAVRLKCLRFETLENWDREFEFRSWHGGNSVLFIVCCAYIVASCWTDPPSKESHTIFKWLVYTYYLHEHTLPMSSLSVCHSVNMFNPWNYKTDFNEI